LFFSLLFIDNALARFNNAIDPRAFEKPLAYLKDYVKLLEETKWESTIVVASAAKSLLLSQIKITIHNHQQWSFVYWYRKRNKKMWKRDSKEDVSWKMLSPLDWSNIYSSILLVLNDRLICSSMGKEKIMLDNLLYKSHDFLFSAGQQDPIVDGKSNHTNQRPLPCTVPYAKMNGRGGSPEDPPGTDFSSSDGCPCLDQCLDGYFSLNTGKFVPKYPTTYGAVCSVEVPATLNDPSHFGHTAWVYRNILSFIAGTSDCRS
jgi:hypothetical protein